MGFKWTTGKKVKLRQFKWPQKKCSNFNLWLETVCSKLEMLFYTLYKSATIEGYSIGNATEGKTIPLLIGRTNQMDEHLKKSWHILHIPFDIAETICVKPPYRYIKCILSCKNFFKKVYNDKRKQFSKVCYIFLLVPYVPQTQYQNFRYTDLADRYMHLVSGRRKSCKIYFITPDFLRETVWSLEYMHIIMHMSAQKYIFRDLR